MVSNKVKIPLLSGCLNSIIWIIISPSEFPSLGSTNRWGGEKYSPHQCPTKDFLAEGAEKNYILFVTRYQHIGPLIGCIEFSAAAREAPRDGIKCESTRTEF